MINDISAFTFGEAKPVLDGHDILDHTECYLFDDYYEMPISPVGLAKSLHANVHHRSAIAVKRNILVSSYKLHPLLSKQDFSRFVFDFLVFGNSYLENRVSYLGKSNKLVPSLAKYTRVTTDRDYLYKPGFNRRHYFKPETVFHLIEPDINQELYGLPEYLASLQSAWLNESATLFRRKYYLNGSHAGFIMYMTDPTQNQDDITEIKKALKNAKGPGNFRNLFLYAPNGKKEGLQIIPIADVSAKDEFFNIKNVTRDDVLAAHRVPPAIMGIIPANTSGFGNVEKASQVFNRNEIIPLQERLKEVNDWLGEEVIAFDEYKI